MEAIEGPVLHLLQAGACGNIPPGYFLEASKDDRAREPGGVNAIMDPCYSHRSHKDWNRLQDTPDLPPEGEQPEQSVHWGIAGV